MRKTKKKLAVLGMSMMIVLGLGVVTYASTTEHTITVKTSYASSSFTYGNGGNELINILYYFSFRATTPFNLHSDLCKLLSIDIHCHQCCKPIYVRD